MRLDDRQGRQTEPAYVAASAQVAGRHPAKWAAVAVQDEKCGPLGGPKSRKHVPDVLVDQPGRQVRGHLDVADPVQVQPSQRSTGTDEVGDVVVGRIRQDVLRRVELRHVACGRARCPRG